MVDQFFKNVAACEQPYGQMQFAEHDSKGIAHQTDAIRATFMHRDVYDKIVAIGSRIIREAVGMPITEELFTAFVSDLRERIVNHPINKHLLSVLGDKCRDFSITDYYDDEFGSPNSILYSLFCPKDNDCFPIGVHNGLRDGIFYRCVVDGELTLESDMVNTIFEEQAFRAGRIRLNIELTPHMSHAGNQYYDNDDLDDRRELNATMTSVLDRLYSRYDDE